MQTNKNNNNFKFKHCTIALEGDHIILLIQ